jgi:hypothetical protein
VRAVEVEVEFNPLYEDIPLFGDIDRFLREQGFVLWRLRDLAHYSQHGAGKDAPGEETAYYDGEIVRFPSGSGQLFWANAFYLRRDTAYPSASAGWEELARDACVTSALGFHDLVGLALHEARRSAPPDVAAALDDALSEDRAAARYERELGERGVVLRETFSTDVGSPAFRGWGWRPVQRVEVGPVRWTGPAREAWIDLPFRVPGGSRIELVVIGGMTFSILDNLVLEVNRLPVAVSREPHEKGWLFAARVPDDYSSERRFTRLVVRTDETVPFNQANPESSDDAELGIALTSLRVVPPPPESKPRWRRLLGS